MENMEVNLLCRIEYDTNTKVSGYVPLGEWDGEESWIHQETRIAWYDDGTHGYSVGKEYAVIHIELPGWMPVDYYCQNMAAIERLYYYGLPREATEDVYNALIPLTHDYRDFAILACQLLRKKRSKSKFIVSLQSQLDAWIHTPVLERKFTTPFSVAQLRAGLKYTNTEAININFINHTNLGRIPTGYKRLH